MLFDIRDKERSLTQGAAKKEKEALGWANEVLVSRSEVEELRQTCQDLETKVHHHPNDLHVAKCECYLLKSP
jgi:hypothetical protein